MAESRMSPNTFGAPDTSCIGSLRQISSSTQRLRHKLLECGLSEATVKECEELMEAELWATMEDLGVMQAQLGRFKRSRKAAASHSRNALQVSFQPSSTQLVNGSQILAYNLVGYIIRVETDGGEGFAHVEINFRDTSESMHVSSMMDSFGFTMGALDRSGIVFAYPRRADDTPSAILYRSWESAEWSTQYCHLDEDVKAVAVGSGWAAAAIYSGRATAATSHHYTVRVYIQAGLQAALTCMQGLELPLAGPVVALAGNGSQLAIVSLAENPLPAGEKIMEFMLVNVIRRLLNCKTKLIAGRLPLSPSSTLTWLGFSSESGGCLCSYDSQGVLRKLVTTFDRPGDNPTWITVFSAAEDRKNETENYWVVGLDLNHVYCVVCKAPETLPQVVPKPQISVLNTRFGTNYNTLQLESEASMSFHAV